MKLTLNNMALRIFLVALLFMATEAIHAQSAAINTNGSSADASAALDIKSTTKGLLIPRMLASERLLIGTPAEGLLVYQTDAPAGFYFYKSGVWTIISGGSAGWGLTGNSGTTDGTNFIGTTDNVALNFRVNNQSAGRIDKNLNNSFYGFFSGISNSSGSYNTANGAVSLFANTTGFNNTATGTNALFSNTTGAQNTATGSGAASANKTGNYNTANGYAALNFSTGTANTAVGYLALNTNTTGGNNTALGSSANVSTGTLNNATAIGANALVDASNKVQIGDGSVTAVQLGTTTTITLETGLIKIKGGTPGSGKVLTSDAVGLASWQAAAGGSGWSLTGNAGTVDGTNFIGTTDNVPFNIRVNNQKAGRIDQTLMNTFFGYQAGNANSTGNNNTANGYQALFSNSTGNSNTANGYQALFSNSTGNSNTANGVQALYFNSTGTNNAANGSGALQGNTTGSNNTAMGSASLLRNTIGNQNTANGSRGTSKQYHGKSKYRKWI